MGHPWPQFPGAETSTFAIGTFALGHPSWLIDLDQVHSSYYFVLALAGLTLAAFGYLTPIVAALMHNVGSLIVIFNSARLVRKGEELEHYQPGVAAPTPGRPAPPPAKPELAPEMA